VREAHEKIKPFQKTVRMNVCELTMSDPLAQPTLVVFVYGTLKPGYGNHRLYCQECLISVTPAKVQGKLYALAAGYPGLTQGDDWVWGFQLTFPPDLALLASLDELEDYAPNRDPRKNLYTRDWLPILTPTGQPLGYAWVYRMAIATVQAMGGQYLPEGKWDAQDTSIG
jgi:gamma-glutamylcyclotransferase (GGCT)/AIG2-like uncharacterized protein YtfP